MFGYKIFGYVLDIFEFQRTYGQISKKCLEAN